MGQQVREMEHVRLSYPSMGWSKIAFKSLVNNIPGVKVVMPPKIDDNIVKRGIKNSPEFVCYPFKVTLGEMINLYEKEGVNNFVMAVDKGPCRFGYYGPVQKRILHDMGYDDVEMFYVQQDDLRTFEWLDMYSELEKLTGEKINPALAAYNLGLFLTKSYYVERITGLEGLIRCREKDKGKTTQVIHELMQSLDEENNLMKLQYFDKKIIDEFKKVDIDKEMEPLKVVYTGEIHVFLEQNVNHYLMRELGELGVEVHKSFDVYDWVMHKFNTNKRRDKLEKIAKKYIPMDIGGEAVWNMGDYLHAQEEGFNGFVHLYPFGCMPEVTFKGIIEANTRKEFYLPYQHFSIDELTGYEGMRTRLETFVKLLKENKKHNPLFQKHEYETPKELIEIYYKEKSGIEYLFENITRPISIGSQLLSLNNFPKIVKNFPKLFKFLKP